MHRDLAITLFSGAILAATATAQVVPILPYSRTMDMLVVDSTYDGVWRCIDRNQDGDLLDANEVISYYSDLVGSIPLGNPSCIATAYDGTVYVGDSTEDVIVAMRDNNGDGDANSLGEHRVFFDSNNLSGVIMASIGGLHVDALGRVFAAVANTSTGGSDAILIFEDLNGDGDANDAGEAREYHTVPGTGAIGDSIPTEVLAGPDLNLYYAEAGATGVITKGVYRLSDNNFDGDCNDPGERTLFWDTSVIGASAPFHYGMAIDATGRFYLSDHSSNETIWTAFDADNSGTIDASEQGVFYQTSASTWWDIVVREDGTVLLCEDQTPDRITALRDLNGDFNAMGVGESREIYDDTLASNPDLRPRGAALMRAPLLSTAPPAVQFGSATSFQTQTSKPVELAAVFLATSISAPVSLAPFGNLEISGAAYIALGAGVSDASGNFSLAFTVPNTPAAIGTYGAQSRLWRCVPIVLEQRQLVDGHPIVQSHGWLGQPWPRRRVLPSQSAWQVIAQGGHCCHNSFAPPLQHAPTRQAVRPPYPARYRRHSDRGPESRSRQGRWCARRHLAVPASRHAQRAICVVGRCHGTSDDPASARRHARHQRPAGLVDGELAGLLRCDQWQWRCHTDGCHPELAGATRPDFVAAGSCG